MTGALVLSAIGFVLLVVASGRFVNGAAGLSLRLRVPSIVIGAVVVGFGTSAPELLASSLAAMDDARDISVGNVVGSNVANLTLVLGVVALIAAPTVHSRVLRREVPIVLGAAVGLALAADRLTRGVSVGLLAAFVVALAVMMRATHVEGDVLGSEAEHEYDTAGHRPWGVLIALTLGGLLGTVAGAHLLVTGAQQIADHAGLSEGLIGFTLVALGTSLPEVVTGIHAARAGDPDLAVGNVFGSNLFNALAITGVAGLISPGAVDGDLVATAWIGVGITVAVGFLMWTSGRLARWEGALLVVAYGASIPLAA